MGETIVIEKSFCGPTESGQGGYVSGLLGQLAGGTAEVTLRVPPPLGKPLLIDKGEDGTLRLLDGGQVVAQAVRAGVEIDVPAPPLYAEAAEYSKNYIGFEKHAFPRCFVCGPQREEGDGLRIFPGRIPGTGMVAAPWLPYASLADKNGLVKPEFVWAALDCPGAFAVLTAGLRLIVLGKLAVSIEREIRQGEKYVVTGWTIGIEGRKLFAGTAIFTEKGELCAKGKATWIELVAGK